MTKTRAPVSIENALFKVLGQLGIEECCEVTARKAHYLRALADPDKREQLTVTDAIKLDLAHLRSGGGGAPIYETIALIIKAAHGELFRDAETIARQAQAVIREGGDAHVALFEAAQPSASDATLRNSLRELEESHIETGKAIALVGGILAARAAQPP